MIIIQLLIMLIVILFAGKTTISLKPFKIKFEQPYLVIGMLLVFAILTIYLELCT